MKRFCVFGPDGKGLMAAWVVTAENGRDAAEWVLKHQGLQFLIGVEELGEPGVNPVKADDNERAGG